MAMQINASTKWIGDTFVEMGVEYTLAHDFTVSAHHGADMEHTRLPKGAVIKKVKAGSQYSPAVWEVTLPLPPPTKPSASAPITRRQLVRVLENPQVFSENTLARPNKDYRPYALYIRPDAGIAEGIGVMLRLPESRVHLPLPYTENPYRGGLYKALDSLPVWARVIVPDDRDRPLGQDWERVFQKTPQGWRDCGLRRERS